MPPKKSILLVGPPGAGKSVFCEQAVLQSLAMDRPVIYVTTECSPSEVEKELRDRGLGEVEPGLLNFVDAYNETVGLLVADRPDTARADCDNLSSIGIAISKLQERIGRKDVLLVFDSLISPYLLSGPEVMKFFRLTLSKFAAEGNSALACMDEGCGKQEDLGAMMSLSSGVLKMEVKEGKRWLDVVKHPKVEPTRIKIPTNKIWKTRALDAKIWDRDSIRRAMEAFQSGAIQKELGPQLAVNLFWPNFMKWSGMFWDPKRFPTMTYEIWKEYAALIRDMIQMSPFYMRLYFRLSIPKSFSKVKDMKKLVKFADRLMGEKGRRDCSVEYLEDISKTDEHYIRVYESTDCWGFENIDSVMASMLPPSIAGACRGLEREERDWNAIETKCIGLGDPYCEFKLVPGEIKELRDSLEKDSAVLERIHDRLMARVMGFLLEGKPLVEGRRLGSDFLMGGNVLAMAGGERYRMALRMGGAKAGKEVGERLLDTGIGEDEAVKRVLHFLDHCKVGDITMDETIRIEGNRESLWTKMILTKWETPSCFFTTGFLNGFFSVVKNQHVQEVKCIAMGDPYCELEFR